ncbi:MAG TPA: TM0106 family RecB-like putative nuclease [Terriglobales bacterium]|nr:TM0106 family RecB-like putative nuclease [Terriglobales bacterium]
MFSATDIASFLACPHTATLARAESKNQITKPFFANPSVDLLQKLGLEHEQRYLLELAEKDGLVIAQIDVNGHWEDAATETVRVLREGVDAVYQATFLEGSSGGRSDFLIRVNKPSALGAWSYEVVETKLARSTKATALVQLCFYSDLLARIQGVEPQCMHVVLGGAASPERFQVQRYIAYFRKVRSEFEQSWKLDTNTYPEPTEHCEVCSWFPICDKRRRDDDHLSFVAGISRNQRKALVGCGVNTVSDLARLALPPKPKIERIGDAALLRIREQARLQVQGRDEGRLVYELIDDAEEGKGLAILPLPSSADLFLDLEANPYVFDEGLEYLIGMATLPAKSGGEPIYESLWALTRSEEKKAFEAFIAKVMEQWRKNPEMHIYHYAPYEPTAIKRLAGRHGTCVDEVDELLRGGVFVDLYRAVRQGIRASVESYSIKRLEPLYGFSRAVPLRDANVALQSFEAAMALGDGNVEIGNLLKTVEGYNKDDCISALRLREWLEDRRKELEAKKGCALPRPAMQSGEPSEKLSAKLQEVRALAARLLGSLPADEAQWTDEHRAYWLLAQMLEWHRREEKSSWWEYFRLCELSDEELQEDRNALGGLAYVGEVDHIKRSIVHRYSFPPQDHAIDRAHEVHDPRTQHRAGELVAIDDHNRTIDLKRGTASGVPHPTALVPYNIVGSTALSDSLFRIASWVAEHGIAAAGQFQPARQLLLRRPPANLRGDIGVLIGEDGRLTEAAKTLVNSLASQPSVLPIQGPPGSGKTFTGARMIAELVTQGRRVGVTAASHKVISTLLHELCSAKKELGSRLRVIQKANDCDGCADSAVTQTESNEEVLDALRNGSANVAAGSAWLWAREEMANSVDVLVVDEAGQMSLANVLAVSPATTSIVLLGDPQQLDQPQKGLHPPGADVSALGHLLNGHATISADQGIFLTETRRLHPDVCAFTSEIFYEGRLVARPENTRLHLNADEPLGGTGLRFAAVEHSGNQNEAPEEVERVAAMLEALLKAKATWTNKKGETHALTLDDILVVAPYNAHVSALIERLPAGSRVGTVDKFQGQEAPIIFYSMATSTPEDAPRGMEFLYSLNRLNVAVSRARCVAVIVASPALFQVQCKTPRQIELANAFCRYLEMALPV